MIGLIRFSTASMGLWYSVSASRTDNRRLDLHPGQYKYFTIGISFLSLRIVSSNNVEYLAPSQYNVAEWNEIFSS